MYNTWFYIITFIFIAGSIFEITVDLINYRHTTNTQDPELRSTKYFVANFKVSLISSVVSVLLLLALLMTGAFGKLDMYLLNFTTNKYLQAGFYFSVIGIFATFLSLPFSAYKTFYIEEKFGFNKTTISTYIADKIKSLLLTVIIGGALLCLILWIYEKNPEKFWLFAWIIVTILSISISMFFTTLLLPIFNKLVPLEEGELKSSIEALCMKLNFPLTKLYVMDGSKRSTKANAFFSGLGPRKAIVLYDTLVNNYSRDEILAVLAHEIGHYKLKHTAKTLVASVIQIAVMFYLLGITLSNDDIVIALGSNIRTFQLSLTAFAILYSPVSMLLSLVLNGLSRKHEYEADAYARKHFSGEHLASALTKLHQDSLSNPSPHPVYVTIHYSHPTLSQRLARLV